MNASTPRVAGGEDFAIIKLTLPDGKELFQARVYMIEKDEETTRGIGANLTVRAVGQAAPAPAAILFRLMFVAGTCCASTSCSATSRRNLCRRLHPALDVCHGFSERFVNHARMRDWEMGIQQVHFALQMNLYDFPVLSCTREVVDGAFVDEYIQDDMIKCRLGDVHIPLYIAFESLFPIDADSRMNEIGAWLVVPEFEPDDLDEGPTVRYWVRSGHPSN